MLKPLFNKNSELVAWISPIQHIFNQNLEWVAYLSNSHAWSARTGNWLGPVHGVICLDSSGKVVAWNQEGNINGTARPARPARAARSARPARPARPTRTVGGWSKLSFEEWIGQ